MKIKKLVITYFVAMFMLGFCVPAFCETEAQIAERFNKTAKELGLTQDQISQMKQIREENKVKTKQIIQEIRNKDKAIDEELLKENYSRAIVNGLLQEIRQLSADMAQLRIDDKIKVRSILTPDQFLKIEHNKQEIIQKNKNHR
jgi:Spy/CpxP family protein refolding chaperone